MSCGVCVDVSLCKGRCQVVRVDVGLWRAGGRGRALDDMM